MNTVQQKRIELTLNELFNDSRFDHLKMMKGIAKSVFRSVQPSDFKDVYLAISKEQGVDLIKLIRDNQLKNIVEFGTSFGISTLFLAQGVLETDGQIITTELINSKAKKAVQNFKKAGVDHLIEVRVGDALETLKGHHDPIDLLLLDGWKDLYWPIFKMLESNFHKDTIVYVDNADMEDTRLFLNRVNQNPKYQYRYLYHGKVALITKQS